MLLDPKLSARVGPEHWFAQAWALALGEVAEALDLGGGAGPLEVRVGRATPEDWDRWTAPLWLTQTWAPGAGRTWLGCSPDVYKALWRHIGGGSEDGWEVQALETFYEMLNQAASGAGSEASARLGATLRASAVEPAPPPSAGWAVELRFDAGGRGCTIGLAGDTAMADTLSPAEMRPPAPSPPDTAQPPRADPLELIREVSLELSVTFGDTTMPLADVLKLSSGTIIELNRSVTDPVEVLVNDSVIARGDVVVVDGNYGVRITEIVSRRDRVRSML